MVSNTYEPTRRAKRAEMVTNTCKTARRAKRAETVSNMCEAKRRATRAETVSNICESKPRAKRAETVSKIRESKRRAKRAETVSNIDDSTQKNRNERERMEKVDDGNMFKVPAMKRGLREGGQKRQDKTERENKRCTNEYVQSPHYEVVLAPIRRE